MSKKAGAVKTKAAPPRAQDLTPEERRQIVLSVPCSQCGSEPGRRCRTPNGHLTATAHAARYAAVGSKGLGLIQW